MRQLCSCIISFEYQADRSTLKAKQVIEHYNWIWSEMTPTKGKIKGGRHHQLHFSGWIVRMGGKSGVTFDTKRNQGSLFTKWGTEAKWIRFDSKSPSIYLIVQ